MIWRYIYMKTTKLLLIGIAFVLVGCGGSSYVAQDMFLVNQGFEELSNSNYLEAESYLRAALAETNRSYQKETPPFPLDCDERREELSEKYSSIRTLPESLLKLHILWA